MIKIKTIEYIKVVYDESLSHNIFSIANVTFTNREPIFGALLYWQKNADEDPYTKHGDYKFFYDMANVQYFASVKFPKYVRLNKEEKQELAYILLEERGSVGSYSFSTKRSAKGLTQFKKDYLTLSFPEQFDTRFLPLYIKSDVSQIDLHMIQHDYPLYEEAFIRQYAKWRHQSTKIHPEQLEPYLSVLDFNYIVATNENLSDQYLIEHINQIDYEVLATNLEVVLKLSTAFRAHLYEQVSAETEDEIRTYFELDSMYNDDLLLEGPAEEDSGAVLEYFEYDRGIFKWPGSEHMIKGIPSYASMQFDETGYKKRTNREMDNLTLQFSPLQWSLFSGCAELHWLHRYREHIDWGIASAHNANLTEPFITTMHKYINFKALGQNVSIRLSESFLNKHMTKFNHQRPQPMIIRNLTESLYLQHRQTINISYESLMQYSHLIESQRLQMLIDLLD